MLFLLFLACFFEKSVAAFDEYLFFSQSEQQETNTSRLLDSEYFSDVLTYQMPWAMQSHFLKKDKVFDMSVGSLSGTRFMSQYRLKIDQEIAKDLTFRLIYAEKKDLELSRENLLMELQYRINNLISFAAYTQLESLKKENDLGVATIVHLAPELNLRLFATIVDFSFNKRTEDAEREIRSTKQYGAVLRWLPAETSVDFLEIYATVQTPLERIDLLQNKTYLFRETRAGTRGVYKLNENSQKINWDLSYRYFNESEVLPVSEAEQGLWRSQAWNAWVQLENPKTIFGLATFFRNWHFNGNQMDQTYYLPHFWYKIDGDQNNEGTYRIGYEATFYDAAGAESLRSALNQGHRLEHRANLRYSIVFSERAQLHLQFSADLDHLSWEGGNGQFQVFF
ncbi:hypothetical protein K2X05_00370 [bacterium]|nr:hypothetical protein [bacterium]